MHAGGCCSEKQMLIMVQIQDALIVDLGFLSVLGHMERSGQTSPLAVMLKLNAPTPSPCHSPAEQACPEKGARCPHPAVLLSPTTVPQSRRHAECFQAKTGTFFGSWHCKDLSNGTTFPDQWSPLSRRHRCEHPLNYTPCPPQAPSSLGACSLSHTGLAWAGLKRKEQGCYLRKNPLRHTEEL